MPPLKPAAAHTATKLAAPRITGAPRPGHPDFTIRTPISPPELHLAPPAAPGAGGSGSQPARPRSPLRSTPTAAPSRGAPHGPRTPTRGAAAAQRCADPRGRSAGGAGAARPRGGAVGSRMPAAPGAVKSQGHKSALFFPLKVKVSGLPRPVIAANAPTFPRPSPRPRGLAAPLPFSGEGCSAALVSSSSSSPWPQPLCKTSP